MAVGETAETAGEAAFEAVGEAPGEAPSFEYPSDLGSMPPAPGAEWLATDQRPEDAEWTGAAAGMAFGAAAVVDETAGSVPPDVLPPMEAESLSPSTEGESLPAGAEDPWAGATWSDDSAAGVVSIAALGESDAAPQVTPRSGAAALSDVEPSVSTRVAVSGLESVAGVTSFRRTLARLDGVQAVSVNALADGSFEFDVSHHPNVDLGNEVSGFAGFDARVMSAEPGELSVYASDPVRYP
jgi:hypothetical protein